MKTLKSVLTLSVLAAFASASAIGGGFSPAQGDTPGWAQDDGTPAYEGIGQKTGLQTESTTLDILDPADYPGAGEDEPGFGEWGPSEAGNVQPGLGAPWSGQRP